MLATKERDAHPGTESDGYIGGLDVYISRIDGSGVLEAAMQKAGAVFSREKFAFLAAFASRQAKNAHYPAAGAKVFLLSLGDAPRELSGKACSPYIISISQRKGAGIGRAFAESFQKECGRASTRLAALGYGHRAAHRLRSARAGG